MSTLSVDTVAIYRASIVGAVKRSSTLMAELVRQVRADWQGQAAPSALEATALQQLIKCESRLVAQYPLAMLELFAQGAQGYAGGSSPTGRLIEIGKDDVRLRVEMVRARQRIAHEAAPALSELDTLIGAAQGFDRVQPERNPLRPGNYVRALFGVVQGADVGRDAARLWLASMQQKMGGLLAREYRRVSEELRACGIQPLHYMTPGRSHFSELTAEDRSVPPRVDVAESFLSPIDQEALPGIDSSMWDSLRSTATLLEPGATTMAPPAAPPQAPDSGQEAPQLREQAGAEISLRHAIDGNRLEAEYSPGGDQGDGPVFVGNPQPAEEPAPSVRRSPTAVPLAAGIPDELDLDVGDWVDIDGTQGRVRTQLTWLSPRRTLFLFTQADGSTQSMTSRMATRMLQSGAMKRLAS